MRTKTIEANGATFKIGQNVKVRNVSVKGQKVQWRMHKTRDRTVQLRQPITGAVVVEYDIVEPVPIAAFYPFVIKKK